MKQQLVRNSVSLVHFLMHLLLWITGVLVFLSVGFAMVDGVIGVRFLPVEITAVAGWIIIVLTVISVLLAFFDR